MRRLLVLGVVLSVLTFAGRSISAQQFSFSNLPQKTQQNSYEFLFERIIQSKITLGGRINVLQDLSVNLKRKLAITEKQLGIDLSSPIAKVDFALDMLNSAEEELSSVVISKDNFGSVEEIKASVSGFKTTLKNVIDTITISKQLLKEAVVEAKYIVDQSN